MESGDARTHSKSGCAAKGVDLIVEINRRRGSRASIAWALWSVER